MTNSKDEHNTVFSNFILTGNENNIPDTIDVPERKFTSSNPFSNFELSSVSSKSISESDEHLTLDDLDNNIDIDQNELFSSDDEHITLSDLEMEPNIDSSELISDDDDRIQISDLEMGLEIEESSLEIEDEHITIDDLETDLEIEQQNSSIDLNDNELSEESLFLEDLESDIEIKAEEQIEAVDSVSNEIEDVIDDNIDDLNPEIDNLLSDTAEADIQSDEIDLENAVEEDIEEDIEEKLTLEDLDETVVIEEGNNQDNLEDERLSIEDLESPIEVNESEIEEVIEDDLETIGSEVKSTVLEEEIETEDNDIDLVIDDDLQNDSPVIISYPLDMDKIDLEINVNDLSSDSELIVKDEQYLYSNNNGADNTDQKPAEDSDKSSLKEELHKAVGEGADPLNNNFFSFVDDGEQEDLDDPVPNNGAENKSETIDLENISLAAKDEEELKEVLIYLDQLFGYLPENVIKDFAQSPYYDKYTNILDKLEL